MGLPHAQDTSALRPFIIQVVDVKYLPWFLTHQHLFGPHQSTYMPSGVAVDITVQANRVEDNKVPISGVPYDGSLRQSLISTEYARATHGRIEQTEAPLSLQDVDGRVYRSSSYITLRWWFPGDSLSNVETFYITEDLPSDCHAMLRRAPDKNAGDSKKALPLFNKAQTAEEEKKRAEERRKREDKTHSAIRDAENQRIVDKTRILKSPSSKQSGNLDRATQYRRG